MQMTVTRGNLKMEVARARLAFAEFPESDYRRTLFNILSLALCATWRRYIDVHGRFDAEHRREFLARSLPVSSAPRFTSLRAAAAILEHRAAPRFFPTGRSIGIIRPRPNPSSFRPANAGTRRGAAAVFNHSETSDNLIVLSNVFRVSSLTSRASLISFPLAPRLCLAKKHPNPLTGLNSYNSTCRASELAGTPLCATSELNKAFVI